MVFQPQPFLEKKKTLRYFFTGSPSFKLSPQLAVANPPTPSPNSQFMSSIWLHYIVIFLQAQAQCLASVKLRYMKIERELELKTKVLLKKKFSCVFCNARILIFLTREFNTNLLLLEDFKLSIKLTYIPFKEKRSSSSHILTPSSLKLIYLIHPHSIFLT